MHALTSLHKPRKIAAKAKVMEIKAEFKPVPRLRDEKDQTQEAFFNEMA